MTGGTAACVVAGRLAAADANLRILLLEAGPTTYNNPAHTEPVRFLNNLAPGSRTVRAYVSRPSVALGGRTTTVSTGQCFGGGSSVNCTSRVSFQSCISSFHRLILTSGCESHYFGFPQLCCTRARLPLTTMTGRLCTRIPGGDPSTSFRY